MNRRELAKKAVLGACAAVLGKTAEAPESPEPAIAFTVRTYKCAEGGGWKRIDGTLKDIK